MQHTAVCIAKHANVLLACNIRAMHATHSGVYCKACKCAAGMQHKSNACNTQRCVLQSMQMCCWHATYEQCMQHTAVCIAKHANVLLACNIRAMHATHSGV